MATAKKTTTAKTTTAKTVDSDVEILVDEVIEDKAEVTPTQIQQVKQEAKVYANGDRIACISVTAGKLVYYSSKTKERYEWSNYGDVTDVLYEDLLSMKSAKSQFIFQPLFVITDENLLSQTPWSKVKEVCDLIEVVNDAEDYLNQTPERLKQLLMQAPIGIKNTIKVTASQMINSGALDSIRKIKVLDEVLGTEFASFIS